MYCQKCGNAIPDESKFCEKCGTPVDQPIQQQIVKETLQTPASPQTTRSGMVCPNCHSANVIIQAVNEVSLKNKHHGCAWWVFVGWWWIPVKWIFLTVPALFAKIFIPKRKKAVNKTVRKAVCQSCGHVWDV